MPRFPKNIIITENQFKPFIKTIILENRESKNLHNARVYLRDNGISEYKAKHILDAIRHDIPNSRLSQCKFMTGLCRFYLERTLNPTKINGLLPFIASEAHEKEYDGNFNGMTFDEIVNRFSIVKDKDNEESIKKSFSKGKMKRNKDYKICKISSYNEAKKFSKYVSWCVTQDSWAYDSYTDNKRGIFYFCLKKGFENLEYPYNGEHNPLDEYGVSMLAISVDKNGFLNTCTSRYNHDNGGNDHILDKDQIEDLLGVNFYETFKPRYTKEELEQIETEKDNKVKAILNNVIKYNNHFHSSGSFEQSGFQLFRTILKNGDIKYLVCSSIYDYNIKIFNQDLSFFVNDSFKNVIPIKNGSGFVVYDAYRDFSNIILPNGSYMFQTNPYHIGVYDNFIAVKMKENSGYVIFDNNLNTILDYQISSFDCDKKSKYIIVINNNAYNIVDVNGNLLFDEWLPMIIYFTDDLYLIRDGNFHFNLFVPNKGFLFDETFDDIRAFKRCNLLKLSKNKKFNIGDLNGNILLDKWYDFVDAVKVNGNNFFKIKDGNVLNVVNEFGKKLFDGDDITNIEFNDIGIAYARKGEIGYEYISYQNALRKMH